MIDMEQRVFLVKQERKYSFHNFFYIIFILLLWTKAEMKNSWCSYRSDCGSDTKIDSALQLFFCYSDAHELLWKYTPEKLEN